MTWPAGTLLGLELPALSDGTPDPWSTIRVLGHHDHGVDSGGVEPVIGPADGFRHFPEGDRVDVTPKAASEDSITSVGYQVIEPGDLAKPWITPDHEVGT